jgi:hypothetical protein
MLRVVQVLTESEWVGTDAIGGFDYHQIPVLYKIALPGAVNFYELTKKKKKKNNKKQQKK